MNRYFSFEVTHKDQKTRARTGKITTPHGTAETPMFMPVGTAASVKFISPEELYGMKAQVILANTYHLWLRPGTQVLEEAGGVHRFMNYDGPVLTDSGGYQVFSLAGTRKISEEGVHFKSHLDGSRLFMSPEDSIRIQQSIGSDIAMSFDE